MMSNEKAQADAAAPLKDQRRCVHCNDTFSKKGNLTKHLKNVHGIVSAEKSDNFVRCTEILDGSPKTICSFSCKDIATLRDHLSQEHHIEMEIETTKFQSRKGETFCIVTQLLFTQSKGVPRGRGRFTGLSHSLGNLFGF